MDANGDVREIRSDQKMNHLKRLSSMIAELLKEGGLSADDIGCVAASEGPGSFTGIRIGVSAARALAQAKGIPAIGVPTLASFVYRMPAYAGVVCPVFDARRGQLYCGAFRLGDDGGPAVLLDGAARTIAELRAALDPLDPRAASEIRFFGDGVEVCGDMIEDLRATRSSGPKIDIAPLDARFQSASSAVRLARHMLLRSVSAERGPADGDAPFARTAGPYAALLPVYMREPEAERKRAEALARESGARANL
jgi:tRNA threonylcarbamoyladenosine biosynthesis protein TsaB